MIRTAGSGKRDSKYISRDLPYSRPSFPSIFSLAKDAVALTFGLWFPYFPIRSPSVSGSRPQLRDGPRTTSGSYLGQSSQLDIYIETVRFRGIQLETILEHRLLVCCC